MRPPSSGLHTIGYMRGLTCLVGFLASSTLILGRNSRAVGIPASVTALAVQAHDELTPGLLVYVDSSGALYLNSKRVTRKQLPAALGEKLARRADWRVYVEGDPNTDYRSVIQAMDFVRRAHASVILLTPKMRAAATSAPDAK